MALLPCASQLEAKVLTLSRDDVSRVESLTRLLASGICESMSSTASRPLGSERTARVTFAPNRARLRASWNPMPELAPVTMAVLPVRSFCGKGRVGRSRPKHRLKNWWRDESVKRRRVRSF